MPPFLILGGISAVLSLGLVAAVRRYALRGVLLDRPTDRSSHSVPVPRGGGLGLVGALLLAFGGWAGFHDALSWQLLLGLAGVALTAMIGWKDDHGGLPVGPRLVGHAVAAAMLVPLALVPEPVPAWMGTAALLWWVFWAVSAINVVNFMDGIDGLIGLQAFVFGLHISILGTDSGLVRAFGVALAGAALGFLVWNWAPAKIFLGDVGSGALGAAMVLGGLLLMRGSDASLATAFLPLYPIFLDSAVTLLQRARRGESLTVAHRSHLYQRLANGGWGHARVSAFYGCVSLVGSALALSRSIPQGVALAVYFVSVAVLGFFLQRAGRRGS